MLFQDEPKTDVSSHLKLRVSLLYAFALLLTALFATAAYFLVSQAIQSQHWFTQTIDASNKMQILVQKVKDQTKNRNKEQVNLYQNEIKKTNQQIQNLLLRVDSSIREKVASFYYAKNTGITSMTEKFLENVNIYLDDSSNASPLQIEKQSQALREKYETLYLFLKTESDARISRIEASENIVYFSALLFLFFEAIFIFKPMVNMVSKKTKEIIEKNKELEWILSMLPDSYFITDKKGIIYDYKLGKNHSRSLFKLCRGRNINEFFDFSTNQFSLEKPVFDESNGEHIYDASQFEASSVDRQSVYDIITIRLVSQDQVYIVRDITEKKELIDKIKESERMNLVTAKMAALGEMASNIAHEINNPLNIIYGRVEQLIDELEDKNQLTPPIRKSTDNIINMVNRMSKIISGLRAYSRDDSQDKPKVEDLYTIINNSLLFGSQKFRQIDCKIEVKGIEQNQFPVLCRSIQLEQVILNLLSNAYDAIHELEEKWIRIEVKQRGSTIRLSVTDSGKGIKSTLSDKITRPFFTTKQSKKSSGLGLSISKRIIEDHNGKIYLDEKSKNTSFIIELPSVNQEKRAA